MLNWYAYISVQFDADHFCSNKPFYNSKCGDFFRKLLQFGCCLCWYNFNAL